MKIKGNVSILHIKNLPDLNERRKRRNQLSGLLRGTYNFIFDLSSRACNLYREHLLESK